MEIRPISDLRNHFQEIENLVGEGTPVFLTKNGHGVMVLMSIDEYTEMTNGNEKEASEL